MVKINILPEDVVVMGVGGGWGGSKYETYENYVPRPIGRALRTVAKI